MERNIEYPKHPLGVGSSPKKEKYWFIYHAYKIMKAFITLSDICPADLMAKEDDDE